MKKELYSCQRCLDDLGIHARIVNAVQLEVQTSRRTEMIRRGWIAATMVCLVAGFAIAATQDSAIDGRWQGTMSTGNGSVTVTYDFETKGQVLTGTESSKSPTFSRSISEGKVNGNTISFKTTVNGNSIDHHGAVSGDTIQLKNIGPGGEFDLTLNRVSSDKKSVPQ
jgi:hypothetical protein